MHKILIRISTNYILWTSIIIILLLRIPPFYMAPINSALVNSHSIARYLLMAILTVLVYRRITTSTNKYLNQAETYAIGVYLLTQSLSITNTVTVSAFFGLYKHIVAAVLLYITILLLSPKKNQLLLIVTILAYSILINIGIQTLIYFFPESHMLLGQLFYDRNWIVVELNAMRNRYFVDIYDTALLPLVFFLLAQHPRKILLYIITMFTILFAYLSNFRSQFAMMLFGLFSGGILCIIHTSKHNYKKTLSIVGICTVIVLIAVQLVPQNNAEVIERIIDPENTEYQTLTKRFTLWDQSIDMLHAHPLFGVGIRNFYDYYRPGIFEGHSISEEANTLSRITLANPHNIFFAAAAETGIIGLLGLFVMLGVFLFYDTRKFWSKTYLEQSLIASFWVLFSYSLLNPPDTLQYLSLLFLLRGLVVVIRKNNAYTV